MRKTILCADYFIPTWLKYYLLQQYHNISNAFLKYDFLVVVEQSFPGGGGSTCRCCHGRGCAAEASKPVPIFKGHFGRIKGYAIIRVFGGKGYPLLGIFSQENDVFVYFSDKMGEITKVGGMFRDFPAQNRDHMFRDSWPKSHFIRAAHPRLPYYVSYPPPPGQSLFCYMFCHVVCL